MVLFFGSWSATDLDVINPNLFVCVNLSIQLGDKWNVMSSMGYILYTNKRHVFLISSYAMLEKQVWNIYTGTARHLEEEKKTLENTTDRRKKSCVRINSSGSKGMFRYLSCDCEKMSHTHTHKMRSLFAMNMHAHLINLDMCFSVRISFRLFVIAHCLIITGSWTSINANALNVHWFY